MDDRLFIKLVAVPTVAWFAVSAYGVATAAPAVAILFVVNLVGSWLVLRLLYRSWRGAGSTAGVE